MALVIHTISMAGVAEHFGEMKASPSSVEWLFRSR
jgi:hypothetical protein